MAVVEGVLKMRRGRRRSGTKHTGRQPHSHRHHENKIVRSEEKALRQALDLKISQVDKPMPLIDIGIDRIDQLIKSIIDPRFGDSIQEAWVRILDDHVRNEEDILRVAREVNQRDAKKYVNDLNKLVYLEKPLFREDGEGSFTLEHTLGKYDTNITNFLNDYQPDLVTHIYLKKTKDVESFGICILCGLQDTALLNGLCEYCWDSYLTNTRKTYQRLYRIQHKEILNHYYHQYYQQRVDDKICLRCPAPPLPTHRYCALHLMERRVKGRLYGKMKYAYRRKHNLCTNCGQPLGTTKTTRCECCLSLRKEYKQKYHSNQHQIRKWQDMLPNIAALAHQGATRNQVVSRLRMSHNLFYKHNEEIIQYLTENHIPTPASWESSHLARIPFLQKLPAIISLIIRGYDKTAIIKDLHLSKMVFYKHQNEIDQALRQRGMFRVGFSKPSSITYRAVTEKPQKIKTRSKRKVM